MAVKIIYLYDIPGWALHVIGQAMVPYLNPEEIQLKFVQSSEYHGSPESCDVLFFSYSGLLQDRVNYGRYAKELICTFHDPFEVSNFTDRYSWKEHAFRRLNPGSFSRISVTSKEMFDIFRANYEVRNLYLTPTLPTETDYLLKNRNARNENQYVTFSSGTNSPGYYSARQVLSRLRRPKQYCLDHRGRISVDQMSSAFVIKARKNIPLLQQIETYLHRRQGAKSNIRYGGNAVSRQQFLLELTQSDVYICTSYMEGGPLPVMEAVMAGNAVLTTQVGQVEEWVTPGVNGYFCHTYDEFVEKIDYYVNSLTELRRHQENSRRISDHKQFPFESWRAFLLGL